MMGSMKLAAGARDSGVTCQTASRWFYAGVLSVAAWRLSNGTILVEEQSAGREAALSAASRRTEAT
jgi:predicted site-specific integrase-resolvase